MLIDTHAHLYWNDYKGDFNDVITRTIESEVTTVVNIGVDVEKSRIAAQLNSDKVKFYATIGIHPHEAVKYAENPEMMIQHEMDKLEEIYKTYPDKVIAVGETGLDFLFENNPDVVTSSLTSEQFKDLQRKLFAAHIDLASKLDLPLVVHCRDDRTQNPENVECWEETLQMVHYSTGILHCYSGMGDITQKAAESNFLLAFAGNITYPKNDYLREAARQLPLEKIVLETDSPFLSPQSRRGRRNEPNGVREIAQVIADAKDVSFEEVASQTTQNFYKLFHLS